MGTRSNVTRSARSETSGETNSRRRLGIPLAIGAVILVVPAIIFSSAGPDRSRTANYKDTIPSAVNPPGAAGSAAQQAKIPNAAMPTAPKSQ